MNEMNSNEKIAWSHWLNCNRDEFSGTNVHRNPSLNETNQIIFLVSKTGFNIAIPAINAEMIDKKLRQLKGNPLPSIVDVINLVKEETKFVSYILYQACLGSEFQQQENAPEVIHLDSEKMEKLAALKQACSTLEWDHSSLNPDSKNTFGIFVKNKLVAAAHYLIFPGKLASIGVLTHPEYRFHGYAQKAALSAINHAIANGYEPHYQTIIENFPAIGLSRKLGFSQFGYSCRIGLK
ncbi:MAG: GNAT family N-acetyltransferase [Anaerolineales bacterium]|jgi:GNAT superfamily N-acetyltransferase